jgi:hypothetical protein
MSDLMTMASPTTPDAPATITIARWIGLHFLPLALLPLTTHGIGALVGLDAASATTHALTLAVVPALQTRLLRHGVAGERWGTVRGVLGLAAAFVVAMLAMSSIDLAGYDTLATPAAMGVAGLVHGVIIGWPARAAHRLWAWVGASALGWVLGTAAYRLLLAPGLRLSVGGHALYGYAYTGGHNELLWMGCGLAGFGIATGALLARARGRRA